MAVPDHTHDDSSLAMFGAALAAPRIDRNPGIGAAR
jgi:hypothetical protein